MNWERVKWLVPVVILAVMPPLFFETGATYTARVFNLVLMFAVLAMALNIVFGHTDQLLLFTGAIVGIGAYTTVLLADAMGISLFATMLVGGLFAGVFGALTCYVAARRRLTVIVISILTISLQFAVIELFNGYANVTGGNTGMAVDKTALEEALVAAGVERLTFLYYAFLVLLAAVLLLYQYLMRSRYGLAFDVIRQDEVAAESSGIAVVRYKTIAGFTATFIMGLVGPLFVQTQPVPYINPGMFSFGSIDVLVLIILVVGGMRTMYGPVLGAAVMIYIDQYLQGAQEYRTMIFGLLLMFLFLFFRNGIVPFVEQYLDEYLDYRDRLAIGGGRGT